MAESNAPYQRPVVSIVLTDMDRTPFALHGFCSWLLQDLTEPYEVIACLFNDKATEFELIARTGNPLCHKQIHTWPRPAFFNISAANNLGLHFARGQWVFFVNSDILYPSGYLRQVMGELRARNLYYVMGSRLNLSQEFTQGLKQPQAHTAIGDYDYLRAVESSPDAKLWGFGSPWIIERETAYAIGGYDPQILCYEDRDISERAIGYLRQRKLQAISYAMLEFCGFHLWHPPSDLYAVGAMSMEILKQRKRQMLLDENSPACIVRNELGNLNGLVAAMAETQQPKVPPPSRGHLLARVGGRLRKTYQTLIRG